MTDVALVLVCKRPALGVGKQRLAASLGATAAQHIAEALLACALEDARDWPGPVVIAPAQPEDRAWAAELLPQAQVYPQTTGNLGQRLNRLDRELRAAGLEQQVYIGSDAPALTAADYAAVRNALSCHDAVLKPAADGGVVLMANRGPWPPLAGLPWSTNRLGGALAECCRATGQSVAMLAHGFDVDEPGDLVKLVAALAADHRPARRTLHALICDLIHLMEASHA